ncbi:uncharacterized protein [Procambarus clarkii]|uniref:uncharacterized protein isoform X2 n=1 Tax=Procambarus clarkii TaxID=6728 RepID=UPI001E678669|nr:uncharacterized protein LOC123764934 isoform X1 [Procambarus clarkii]
MKTGSRRLIQGSPFALMIFSRMASLEIWRPVEESEWRALSSMGTQWMVKSFASNQGYMAMVTDGCALWGENRDAKYIHKQAEVWAPCVEGGIKELSSLVLEELTRLNVKVLWMGNRESLTLSISSELHDLSYKWQFELKRLSDELFSHHWVTPMLVQIQLLGSRVKQLTAEVKHKQRQLEELLPDIKASAQNCKTNINKDSTIESATEAVLVKGPWVVLQDHLTHYPLIMRHLAEVQNKAPGNTVNVSIPGGGKKLCLISNNGNQSSKKPLELETEMDVEREAEKERKRREKIQEITQGTAIPATQIKKKKKLNI